MKAKGKRKGGGDKLEGGDLSRPDRSREERG